MDWQPIETAPKDGSVFLGYWPNNNGPWSASQIDPLPWRILRTNWWALGDNGTWNGQASQFEAMLSGGFPTHWMPLPEPPK